jgi:hypothetical protein
MQDKVKELVERLAEVLVKDNPLDYMTETLLENCKAELERLSQPTIKTDNTQVILNLQAELERLEVENAWQPIESAPKDGTAILVHHPKSGVCEGYAMKKDGVWYVMDGVNQYQNLDGTMRPTTTYLLSEPTHWKPLPKAPEGV